MNDQSVSSPITAALRDFMRLESASGLLLLAAAVLAMLVANSPIANLYDALLDTTAAIQIGALSIEKPLLLWVNDGLMAIFFFLVGLEIKREVMEGELSSFSQVVLPGMGCSGRNGGSSWDLCMDELGRSGCFGRVGHTGGNRHRVCVGAARGIR